MAIPLDQQNIISLLGIESLPDEQKVSIVDKVATLVEKRLLLRVLESLNEAQREEFNNLLAAENGAGVGAFLEQHVPNLAEWAQEETNAVKQDLAEWAENLADN